MSEWTAERIDLLREMAEAGSNSWITREINTRTKAEFTRNAIIGKKARMGLGSASPPGGRRGKQIKPKPRRRIIRQRSYPTFEPEPTPMDFLALDLTELLPDECRYPQGNGPFTFCGQPAVKGSSYCAYHHRVCYTPKPERPVERIRGKLSVGWGTI